MKFFLNSAVAFTMAMPIASAQEQQPAHWDVAFPAAYKMLEGFLQGPGKSNPYWHVHPSTKWKYPGVYLWDSAFIALIWKHHNSRVAEDVIRSVLHNQLPDGRVPHVVSIMGKSPWTQPPVLSWAAADILRLTQNVDFVASVYPKLRKYQNWLWKNRQLPNGLFFWGHAYESGIDNSPRFGNRDESYRRNTTNLAAVDMSSYIVMDAKAMEELAAYLLKHATLTAVETEVIQADLVRYQERAASVSKLIREQLWDEETGLFYDRNMDNGQLEKISTVASFFPLTAGVATEAQYRKMRPHIVSENEYNTNIPFPTVSKADPTFEKDMWRGPVWVNTSYLAIRGVKNYEPQLAKHLSRNLIDGVYKTYMNTGTFAEFYDPDRHDFSELSRKKGTGPLGLSGSKNPIEVISHLVLKQIILGKKPVTPFMGWTGLVNTLAVDEFNYKPQRVLSPQL